MRDWRNILPGPTPGCSRVLVGVLAMGLSACTGGEGDDPDLPFDSTDPGVDPSLPTPVLAFADPEPRTGDDVVVVVQDPDPAVTYAYAWRRDGNRVADLDGDTVSAELTAKGERWSVDVRVVVDGRSGPTASEGLVIRNTPPEVLDIWIDPDPASAADDVFARAEITDVDPGDEDSLDMVWSWELIEGGSRTVQGERLSASFVESGNRWRLTGTPTDGDDEGEPLSIEFDVINAPPVIQGLSLSPTSGTTSTNFSVTVSAIDPDDSGPVTIRLDWFIDDGSGPQVAQSEVINQGEVPSLLLADKHRRGDVIWVVATPSDGMDEGEPEESVRVTIANTPPDAFGSRIDVSPEGEPITVLSTLTCVGLDFFDVDGDPEGWQYRWFRGGTRIQDQEDATLTGEHFAKGQAITCEARPFDGTDVGLGSPSGAVTIVNAPPVVEGVDLQPQDPAIDATLTATPVGAYDPDGDPLTFRWTWRIEGDVARTHQAPTSSLQGPFSAGDRVSVELIPWDTTDEGEPVSAQVVVANTPPEITSLRIEPEAIFSDTPAQAVAETFDADGQSVTVRYNWRRRRGTGSWQTVQTGSDPVLSPDLFRARDLLEVIAVPNDQREDGAPRSAGPVEVLNRPPEVTSVVVSPVDPDADRISREVPLRCDAEAVDADDDPVTLSYRWVVNDEPLSLIGQVFPPLTGRRGDTVACRVVASDGTADSVPLDSEPVVLENAPPSITGAVLSSVAPEADETLSVQPQGWFDADDDPEGYRYAWFVGGEQVSTDPELSPSLFGVGQAIYVVVTPYDGIEEGEPVTSNQAVPRNSPPRITLLRVVPTEPGTLDDLVAEWDAVDDDGDDLTATFRWFLGTVLQTEVTGDTFPADRTERGDQIRLELIVDDGQGGSDSAQRIVSVLNTRPTLEQVLVTPASPSISDALVCTPEGWFDADGDPPNYLYTWRKVGQPASIGTGSILTSGYARGDEVVCEVLALDGDPRGPGDPFLSEPVTIVNSPPTVESAVIDQEAPRQDDELTVTITGLSDPDGDPVQARVDWWVNDELVHSGDVLTGEHFRKGDEVLAQVTPSDDEDEGAPVWSPPVVVVNTPPVIRDLTIEPNPAYVDTDLEAVYTVYDPDPDDEGLVEVTHVWRVANQVVDDEGDAVLPAGVAQRDQGVVVTVQASDPDETGEAVFSPARTIANRPPTVASAVITPEVIRFGVVPTCEASGWFDPDGDPEDYRYRWFVNGTLRGTNPTLSTSQFAKGDILRCELIPYDGLDEGPAVAADEVEVANTPPTMASVDLVSTPTNLTTNAQLRAVPQGATDVDIADLPLSFSFTWRVNDVVVTGVTGDTLPNNWFQKGDTVLVTATASDGTDEVSRDSVIRTVGNSPPVITAATLGPDPAYRTDELVVTASYTDPDPMDTLTATVDWFVNSVRVPGQSGMTFPANTVRKYDRVVAVVKVTDGDVAEPSTRPTNSLDIANTRPVVGAARITSGVWRNDEDELVANRLEGLLCEPEDPFDPDPGDTVLFGYSWQVNGTVVSSSNFLQPDRFRRNDRVVCRITPFDGDENGLTVASEEVRIVNAPPRVVNVSLSTDAPNRNNTVRTTLVDVVDPDPSDVPGWRTDWFVGGVQVASGGTLFPSDFARGQTIQARITPFDGFGDGEPVWTDELVVVNAPPVFGGPPRILPNGQTVSTIRTRGRAHATVPVTDADNDDLEITWSWRVNGTEVLVGEDEILDGDLYFSKGQTITLQATVSDGFTSVTSSVSSGIFVEDTLPTVPHVRFFAGYPTTDTGQITCRVVAGGEDDDGDEVAYAWTLRADETNISAYTTSGLDGIAFQASLVAGGEVWRCEARAHYPGEPWNAGGAGLTSFMEPFGDVRKSCPEATAAQWTQGIYSLDHDGDDETPAFRSFCQTNASIAGGGWTRVIRTTGQNDDLGQRTTEMARLSAAIPGQSGPMVWEAALRHDTFSEILIRAASGGQVNQWRHFVLDDPPGMSLYEIFKACRDQPTSPNDDGAFPVISSTGHTSVYSGTAVAGTLGYYRPDGVKVPLEYVSLCGVSTSADNDVSYLAFHTQPLDDNDYGDNWRGRTQAGTLWSFANGNYAGPLDSHIGGKGLETLAGWKGDAGIPAQALGMQGTYEVFIR